MYSFNYL